MINHKGSFYLGIFVFLIPFLGFPTIWKMGFVLFAGILLIVTSIRIPTPRRILRNQYKKEKTETPLQNPQIKVVENIPVPPVVQVAPPIQIIKPTPTVKKVSIKNSSKIDSVRKKIKEL